MQGRLWLDIVAAIPGIILPFAVRANTLHPAVIQVIVLLRLLRLLRVLQIVKRLSKGQLGSKPSTGEWLTARQSYLVSLIYCLLVTVNLLACLWYSVANYNDTVPRDETWLGFVSGRNLTEAPLIEQYLASLYYTVSCGVVPGSDG